MAWKPYCLICEVTCPSNQALDSHRKSVSHRKKLLRKFYTIRRDAWTTKKDDIDITVMPPVALISEEKVRIKVEDDHPPTVDLTVTNVSGGDVMLENVQPLYSCDNLVLDDEHELCKGKSCIQLKYGAAYTITFSAKAKGTGCFEVPVFFQYRKKNGDQTEHQLLLLCIDYVNKDDLRDIEEAFIPSEDSLIKTRRMAPAPPTPKYYIPGKPQPGFSASEHFKFLFPYPAYLRELVVVNFNEKYLADKSQKAELKKLVEFGKEGLSVVNYDRWFELQLWIEEIEQEINLHFLHMNNVEMMLLDEAHGERMVALVVPGVEENHPNIMCGDSIFVKFPSEDPPVIYEGIVHLVVGETVHLGFGDEFLFMFRSGMKVNVQFWFPRTVFMRCHAVLRHYHLVKNFLFPKVHLEPINRASLHSSLKFFNKRIAVNPRQRKAVQAIVNEVSAPAPYIIFGPPGTGKTSTLVEAIKQVYKLNPKSSILVCGPSNASCDILAKGLLEHIPHSDILRINAKYRKVTAIPESIKKVSYIDGSHIQIPSMDFVRTYSIVVMTYVTAYNVVPVMQEKTEVSSFSHVFLDECGYTLETQALIPLLVLPRMVVIAGDPYQLGPVVSNMNRSKTKIFRGFRLDQSYMERLMAMDMYKPMKGVYNERYITKLLLNYRSHAKILEVSNKLFYEDQLKARADHAVVNSLLNWEELPNKKIPVVFHGVNGREERKANNPSFFNRFEVSRVVKYVKKLITARKVKHEDIGIVTPYREQMKKIRDALNKDKVGRHASKIRIGTPEVFQGDERHVIIVSTVRANPERLHNTNSRLGFLSNPKRFNVAITRARALLVVIGYPWLLERDKYWGNFLQFCWDHDCYKGCHYDPSEKDVREIEDKFQELKIPVVVKNEEMND